jgi:hypothetical protein
MYLLLFSRSEQPLNYEEVYISTKTNLLEVHSSGKSLVWLPLLVDAVFKVFSISIVLCCSASRPVEEVFRSHQGLIKIHQRLS